MPSRFRRRAAVFSIRPGGWGAPAHGDPGWRASAFAEGVRTKKGRADEERACRRGSLFPRRQALPAGSKARPFDRIWCVTAQTAIRSSPSIGSRST